MQAIDVKRSYKFGMYLILQNRIIGQLNQNLPDVCWI